MDCREKIVSEDFLSIIVDFPTNPELFPEYGEGFCFQPLEGSLGVYYTDGREVELSAAQYLYRYIPQLYGLLGVPAAGTGTFDPQPLESAGILNQQRPPLELTGRGVIVAVIDTGISYENPVFRYSDGSTRIHAIWDQTDQTGTPPEGFAYGTEYVREQIDEALQSGDPHAIVPQRDEIGHGTALASVAAGSRIDGGITFTGAAPDAGLVVVKLKPAKQRLREYYLVADGVPAYSTDDLLFAVKYAQQFAQPFLRPVVMCIGLGTSLGSHNGGSILSGYLETVGERLARAVVIAGGNEGNTAGHFRSFLTPEQQQVEIRVGENTRGFLAELWGQSPARFSISVRSPGGESTPEVDFRLGKEVDYRFVYEKSGVRINYVRGERNTGDELIIFRFDAPTPGIWTITVRGVRVAPGSVFDIWLTMRQFQDGEAYFLMPTPEVTLTMPSYAENAVTVSAYNSAAGSFFYQSGQGFSRSGAIKPDLAAPGVAVSTAIGPYSGTAVSAAMTAGAAAQLLQWCVAEENAPFVSSGQIRDFFIRGAAQEAGQQYPNRQWGNGRLDLGGTFDEIAGR